MDRPICEACNKNLAAKRGNGFRKKCDRCQRTPESAQKRAREAGRRSVERRRQPWKKFRKDYCESPKCKWSGPLAPFQLSVDHIDGNKDNNDPSNLQTLCHNCHAMKTWTNLDWLPSGHGRKNVWVPVDTIEVSV